MIVQLTFEHLTTSGHCSMHFVLFILFNPLTNHFEVNTIILCNFVMSKMKPRS